MSFKASQAAFLIAILLGSSAAYYVGRTGVDVRSEINTSRCESGAFIEHSKTPSSVQADAHSDEAAITATTGSGQAATYAAIQTTPGNLIANGALEQANGIRPAGWDSNSIGSNTAKFTVVPGASSTTGLRIDVTNYKDGTADWFGPDLTIKPGYYQFQDTYRSNVDTRAVLKLTDTTGKSQYINLDSTPASTAWAAYTQRFYVPANVTKIMISHPLDRAGWLETDNFSLLSAVAPTTGQAMVSITFDDGWSSIYTNALPLLKKYSLPSTQYIVSGFLGGLKDYMTPKMVYAFKNSGSEIASHTVDHPDLTKLSTTDLTHQLATSDAGLTKCFGDTTSFAAPFGTNNQATITAEKPLYETSRSTDVGYNSPDTFDAYSLKVQNVRQDTSPAQIAAWVQTAKDNHVWLILVYHQINDGGGEYSRKPADLDSDLKIIVTSGVPVKTVHDAYATIQYNIVDK